MSIETIGNRSITFEPGAGGESNQTVADVQRSLNRINENTELPENGVFDQATEDAIRSFQNSNRLPDTGTIDQPTIQALNRQLERSGDESTRGVESGRSGPLSDADRGRRIQELRIQEPVVRHGLEGQHSYEGRLITDGYEPPDAPPPRPEPHYEAMPRELGHERYNTATAALNDPNPHRVNVRGHDFRICGASDSEASVIRNTLSRLPASHLDRIPPTITVSERLTSNSTRGGAQRPGDPENPRIEMSRESLRNASARVASGHRGTFSSSLLHEAGHCVGSGTYGNHRQAYRTAPNDLIRDLPADVPSNARDPEGRGRIERYAQAYMMYFGGRDRRRAQGLTPEQREAMSAHFRNEDMPAPTSPGS